MEPAVENPELMLKFCKAMADESRLKIVALLAGAEHSVQDLAAMLNLKEPTVSHHLGVLKVLNLVRLRADGNVHWYRLSEDDLRKISRQVFSRESIASIAAPMETDDWERKVLGNFVRQDRLTEIPVSRKKRYVILKWLARCFQPEVDYSEAAVNANLKERHQDCATLRRELIGYRMLTREKGVYRRNLESEWRPFDK